MKKFLILTMVIPLAGLFGAFPMANGDEGQGDASKKDRQKIAALIQQLGAQEYKDREDAYEALKPYGGKARSQLEKALKSEDLEIRWRASRLLSYLEGNKDKPLQQEKLLQKEKKLLKNDKLLKAPKGEPDLSDLEKRLRKLEEMLPGMGFRSRGFFHDDEEFLDRWFDDWGEAFHGRFPSFRLRLFDDDPTMDRLMKALKENRGDLGFRFDGGGAAKVHMERSDGEGSESRTLEIREDGSVVATVTKTDGDGESETNTYKAESLAAFKKAYPEVAGTFNLGGLDAFALPDAARGTVDLGRGFKERPERLHRPGEGKTRKTLGIYLDPNGLDKVLRTHLGVKEGEGVVVQRVLPDAFAGKVGLENHDVIISVNGKPVGGAEDIRSALSPVQEGDTVEIILFRNGEKKALAGKYALPDGA